MHRPDQVIAVHVFAVDQSRRELPHWAEGMNALPDAGSIIVSLNQQEEEVISMLNVTRRGLKKKGLLFRTTPSDK